MDNTTEMSAQEVNDCFAKNSSEYMMEEIKKTIEKINIKSKGLAEKKNYVPTFRSLLQDNLREIQTKISTEKMTQIKVWHKESKAELYKLNLENQVINQNGHFGHWFNFRGGSLNTATKQARSSFKRDDKEM